MLAAALKTLTASVTPSYAIDPDPTCFAGPWRVHGAVQKSTGQAVSVFIWDRKNLSGRSGLVLGSGPGVSAHVYETVTCRLKAEAANLARLRHPSVLQLIDPVEETRGNGLMFVTERISNSLTGLFAAANRAGRTDEPIVGEIEMQKGLVQVGKGLDFLHNAAHLVHGNLTPNAIVVTAKGDWRLTGLTFTGPENTVAEPLLSAGRDLPDLVRLDIDYAAPELVLDNVVSYAADMFSLGLIIATLSNRPHESVLRVAPSESAYRRAFGAPSTTPSRSNRFLCSEPISGELADLLAGLLTRRPESRLTASQFVNAPFFDNVLVSTLRFLDEFAGKTAAERTAFIRGLPRVQSRFSARLLENQFIPVLTEQLKDPTVSTLALQTVFSMVDSIPAAAAGRALTLTVLPQLHDLVLPRDIPADRVAARDGALSTTVANIALLAKSVKPAEFRSSVMPLFLTALHSKSHPIVESALQSIGPVIGCIEFMTVKNELFPPVAAVFSKTTSLAVKISALDGFTLLCSPRPGSSQPALDKFTMQEKIVPLLRGIKTKEPAVMMATLAVFEQVGQAADIRFLASDVIPILWRFSLGPLLNLAQFSQFSDLIGRLSRRVVEEHSRSLREISSVDPALSTITSIGPTGLGQAIPGGTDLDFDKLVLGRHTTGASASAVSVGASLLTVSNPPHRPASANSRVRPGQNGSVPALVPVKAPVKPTSSARAVVPKPAPPQSLSGPPQIDWSAAKKSHLSSSSVVVPSKPGARDPLAAFPTLQPVKKIAVPPSSSFAAAPSASTRTSQFSIPPPPSRPPHPKVANPPSQGTSLLDE